MALIFIRVVGTLVVGAVLAGGLLSGQAITPPTGQPADMEDTPQLLHANLGSDPVAVGDLVYLSVTGSPELTRSYRVSGQGQIALPMMKEGINIAGLTPDQIAQVVTGALTRERILVRPVVFAEVMEYRSRMVSVVGSVKYPTVVQAIGNTTLLDAIAKAQGLSPEAGPEIIVSRPGEREKPREVTHIPVKALFSGNEPGLNIVLHGGEEIRVPEAPKLYIMGNVKTPGVFPLTELDGSTVLKALALSQGTLSFSAKKAYVYRLNPGVKERQEIMIELAEILHRKAPDVPLQANDILYIPENSKMKLSATVLDHLSGFGTSTASGLIVWH
jgi:polysaccharide export outer membrane protein